MWAPKIGEGEPLGEELSVSAQVETIIDVDIHNRNKQTVFWRGILIAPVLVFIASFGQAADWGWGAAGVIAIPVVLSLLFRGVYPSYVLTFNHAMIELMNRALVYLFLLTDEYPSIERNPRVAVIFPDIKGGTSLNRWLPLVKWFLAIPLYIVGFFYSLAAVLVSIIAWIQTFLTGEYPESSLKIVLGSIAYWNRVFGYCVLLVTDEYPSFSL